MTRFYTPATHDPLLERLNIEWQLDDYEIAQRMQFCVQTIKANRKRLGLKACPRQVKPHFGEDQRRPLKDKTDPIRTARNWLGKRLVEKESGFWLDGLPASLTNVMRETNRLLANSGAEQIVHNPLWKVHL